MKVFLFINIMILIQISYSRDLSGNSIFADRKARFVGDILNVRIVEKSKASNEAKTTTGNSNKMKLQAGGENSLSFIPTLGASGESSSQYSGSGATERKGSIQAAITAQITRILPNGNLFIEGHKIIEVNGEKQITSLKGEIRVEDISAANYVLSTNIAGLEILYTGEGVAEEAEKPGIFTRFFNWLF